MLDQSMNSPVRVLSKSRKRWLGGVMCMLVGFVEAEETGIDYAKGREFWSFQPLELQELPAVKNDEWAVTRLDRFVLARLEAEGLSPSKRANRRTLLRRLTFDLTGLPPTPQEADAFLADESETAYEKLVDRLLASSHFGERWARTWLDVARYTDIRERWVTTYADPYVYRDWVVRAMNEDLPYDQFAKRQLATDLMPETGPEEMAALGFLGVSPVYHKEKRLSPEVIRTIVAEEWEERVDTLGRAFLGLTIACARCHDHKSDPISAEDYYALAGVFASVRRYDRSMLPEEVAGPLINKRKDLVKTRTELRKLLQITKRSKEQEAQLHKLKEKMQSMLAASPQVEVPLVPAVIESSIHVIPDEGEFGTKLDWRAGQPRNLRLQIRGDPANLGAVVRRRFLRVLSGDSSKPFQQGSGRLELAEAIFKEGVPLAARVMVNRIWREHFGKGLVTTPSDFGSLGQRPSHPKLLDDLAARFVKSGWSLKWLHREIVLSATYRQQSAPRAEMSERDPENRLLWRMNRRRLEIEMWRDAMLQAAGRLDRTVGGAPGDLGGLENVRRTIYGEIDRRDVEPLLRLYDFPDPDVHSPKRVSTISPLQQLFVLNGEFMRKQSEEMVKRLEAAENTVEARIQLAYRHLFAREATPEEIATGVEFLSTSGEDQAELWNQYAQVLLGSNEFQFVD